MSTIKDLINERAFDKEAWKQQKQEVRSKAFELVDKATSEVVSSSANFKQYLDIESKHDQYSYRNLLLIFAQKPNATQIKDAKTWKEQHVYVKRNEKSFIIIEPNGEYQREDGTMGINYNAKSMFDVSQTSASMKIRKDEFNFDNRSCLQVLLENAPVNIIFKGDLPNNSYAFYAPSDRTIYVSPDLDSDIAFSALAKEIAHAEMDMHDGTYDRNETSLNAYCSAYMLSTKFNLDTSNFDFSFIPDTYKDVDSKDIQQDLSKLRNSYASLSERVDKNIYALKEQQKSEQTQVR